MTNYQWVPNSKPDRPGIWAVRNTDGSASIREIKNPESWGEYTWAFICDLPDIKDPPKREPREITLYSRNGHIGVVQLDDDCEAILFREVID